MNETAIPVGRTALLIVDLQNDFLHPYAHHVVVTAMMKEEAQHGATLFWAAPRVGLTRFRH